VGTYRISSEKLKKMRKQARLTQEELAALAECSDRVVRKAEAGGSLRYDTIELLCSALTECGVPVAAEDLIAANLLKAQQLVASFRRYGRTAGNHFPIFFLSGDLEFFVAGDASVIPFAGQWNGRKGFEKFLDTFFDCVHPDPSSDDSRYAESKNHVVASWHDRWHCNDVALGKIWCNFHLQFINQSIVKIDFQYDTGAVYQKLANHSSHNGAIRRKPSVLKRNTSKASVGVQHRPTSA
jgi:transcriptional regulator with XRE-family HTH domain